ncbi:MAG: phage head closure protein [Rhizobiales bacterium]|nr:phage head closure protein [Hyphomicrobiales bacterium]
MPIEFIDAGRFSLELVLEARSGEVDDYGGFSGAWNEVAMVWARLEPLSSAATLWAGQSLADATHRVTMRHRDGVRAGMRLRKGTRAFLIRTVTDPDETGRYLVCITQEEK